MAQWSRPKYRLLYILICNSQSFQIADYERGPPKEKMNEVIELNSESKGKELQYYLIACRY